MNAQKLLIFSAVMFAGSFVLLSLAAYRVYLATKILDLSRKILEDLKNESPR